MNVDYELVQYSDAIRDAYLELLPEQEQAIARGKLEWKLRRNPGGTGLISVARAAGEVIGLNAFMACGFRVNGRRQTGYQSMDTIVTEAARGKGVFGKLIRCFYDQAGASLLYGFPNDSSAPGFFGKLGWARFGAAPMLIRPLRTGYFFKRVARFLPDLRIPIFSRSTESLERIGRFDGRATALWERFSTTLGCAVERDANYLNWRLVDHPSEEYIILGDGSGGSEGFAAYTISEKHGGRIGYLMEAIGDSAVLPGLISAALRKMQAAKADAALAWCLPWSPNYRAYRKAGFYPLPAKLRPIIINFGARPLDEAADAAGDARSWYVSYLDSDTV